MKYWMQVRVQCEAQEVLGVKCDEITKADVLHHVGMVGTGGSTALVGGFAPPKVANLVLTTAAGVDWAMTKRRPGGAPCFFCPKHKEAGLAKIDGKS